VFLLNGVPPFAGLEAEVLQRLRRPPVLPGRFPVVAPPRGEVSDRYPGSRPVACRSKLLEARIGSEQHFSALVRVILLEQGSAERELRSADLLEVVDSVVEQLQGVPGVLLGLLVIARREVHLGEGVDELPGIRIVAELEGNAKRVLQVSDR